MDQKLRNKFLLWMGGVLCLAYLLPNHYSPWLSVHQELGAAIAFAPLLIWACVRFSAIPSLAIGAAALSMVPLLQLATGQLYFAADGWIAAMYLMGFAHAVLAGACCVEQFDRSKGSALTVLVTPWMGLLLAALVSVGIAIYQWLMLGDRGIYVAEMPPNGRPFGNLAQPNQLATLLLLGVAGVLFLWEAGKLHAATALAAALMLVFGLVLTGSRSVVLTLVWLVPAYGLMRRRCHLRTTPAAVAAVIAFYVLVSVSWSSLNNLLLLASDVNTAVDRMGDPGIRKVFWQSMLDAIGRAPWAGYGWGQIGVAQTATALDYPATHSFFDSAHNVFLDLALWNGLPLALLVTVGLLLWLVWQVRQCRDPLSFAVLVAVGAVLSHAMVEYPLSYAYFLLPVGLWMGALSAAHPSAFDRIRFVSPSTISHGLVATVGVGMLSLCVIVAGEYFPFEADWRLMRFQEARIGNLEHTESPPATILTNLRAFMQFSRTEAKPGMSVSDLEGMRKVSERYAYASSMYRYALAQALNQQTEGAQQTLRKLCQMQTPAACLSARQDWNELTRNRYPQLMDAPFPEIIALKH